jgi:hypothetical protein
VRLSLFLLLSLSLHLVTIFFSRKPVARSESPPTENLVFLEPNASKGSEAGNHRASPKTSSRPRKSAVPALTLSDLGIGRSRQEPAGDATEREAGTSDSGSSVLESLKRTVPLESLYRRLDQAVYYPKELIDADIEGRVTGKLVFNPQGEFLPTESHIISDSNYLRVYVLKAFRSALKAPLRPMPPNVDDLVVRFTVTFELTRTDNAMDGSRNANLGRGAQKGLSGYNLALYRSSKVIGQWKLGPLSGYGIAPSVGIDPGWFVDGIEKLYDRVIKQKAEIDPLELYRNDPAWKGSNENTFERN